LALPDALVLDLDGTLIDSAADLADSVNRLLAEMGRPEVGLEAVRGMIGDGLGMLAYRALAATGAPPDRSGLPAIAARLLAHYVDPARELKTLVFDRVPEVLAGLSARGVKLALCTNKAQEATELVLKKTGLAPLLDCAVGFDLAPAPKPDPAHVRKALEMLGHPARAVMVGDSGNDLKAGQAAGLPVVLVTYGYGTPAALAAADATISHFGDLPAALENLGFGG
jgi:phosphoglycolate phosphatase